MKKYSVLFISLAIFLNMGAAYPFWIWSPRTAKFVNPKSAPRQNPKEQLKAALEIFQKKDYETAIPELRKVIKYFPKAYEAAEAQFYLGECFSFQNKLYEAFKEYQATIDKYPFSERIQEIIKKEFAIAEKFISGEAQRKALGIKLPIENPGVEILQKVVDNSTYGPLAPVAQYKLGLLLKSLGRYYDAEEAFNKVIKNYPDSEWVAAARFQNAAVMASTSSGPEYDPQSATEAKKKYQDFLDDYPDAELSKMAQENIKSLRNKEAEFNFETARFYEKQKAYKAARIYYKIVADKYYDSSLAAKALERLAAVEKQVGAGDKAR